MLKKLMLRSAKFGFLLISFMGARSVWADQSLQAEPRRTQSLFFDLYAESYNSPLQDDVVHFQRLRLKPSYFHWEKGDLKANGFVGIESTSQKRNSYLTSEVGSLFLFQDIQFIVSYRREYLNVEDRAFHSLRAGVVLAHYWALPVQNTFTEYYFEAFQRVAEKRLPLFIYSGWAKLGYRMSLTDFLSWDPAVVGVRIYDSTDAAQAGVGYRMIQLGTQATFYKAQNNTSASIGAFKAWTSVRSSQNADPADYWFLLSLGVQF